MSVSNEFKNITKKIKQQNIKLSICDGELTVKEIHMMPVHIFNALPVWKLRKQKVIIAKELKYSFDGQLFKTIMKQIEITVKNANEIKDKDINFQYGLFIKNKFEYIDLGNYFIKDVEDSKKKDEIKVTGYDRMIRFMKTFKQSELQLTYPCKMLKLVQKICEVCGVELYSTDFYNADLDVKEDFFTAQQLTYRDVLEKIAQATLTTIFIEDNKLNLYKVNSVSTEKIDKSFLTDLTIKEKFGPVNVLVLGRGDVEDNIEEPDEKSIKQNGRCEIRFDENEFVEFQREKVIKGMFEQIKGLEYYSFEASDVGVMWLKPCACIELGDKEDSLYKSYYLKANITINTGISSDTEAELPEQTNTEYKITTKEEKKTLKVERLAKKNEGKIQDLVEEVGDRSEKKTSITQDINGITQSVSEVEEKVENVEKTANTAKDTAENLQNTSISKVEVKYALSDSSTDPPTTGWSTTAPKWTDGKFMWQKTTTTYANNKTVDSAPTCLTGATGQTGEQGKQGEPGKDGTNGKNGATGKGIKSIKDQYYLSNSNKTQTGGNWKDTQDQWSEGKYIWTRSHIIWTDDTETNTTPVLADALNNANSVANDAKNIANETDKTLKTQHYTKTETDTKIESTSETITANVTKQISEATDEKLKDYSTTSEMKAAIELSAKSLSAKISDVENVTKKVDETKTIILENAKAGALIELHILGNNKVFEPLLPSDDLFPADDLLPAGDSLIAVTDSSGNVTEYELGILDTLRASGNVKDEFILKNGSAKVIRRISTTGTIKGKETTEELGDIYIGLSDGTNTISIKNYSASISATYATINNFTDIFASRVETNAKLELTNSQFKVEMSKKVGKEEVVSTINQTPEDFKIKANKVDINGTVSANGNFKILEDGSMEAKNGTFSGNLYVSGNQQIVNEVDGIVSNIFSSNNGPVAGGYDYLGYTAFETAQMVYVRNASMVNAYVPAGFKVLHAYVTLLHISQDIITKYNKYGDEEYETGKAKNIKFYKGTSNPTVDHLTLKCNDAGFFNFNNMNGEDITKKAFNFDVFDPEIGETISNDLADLIEAGKNNTFYFATTITDYDNKSSSQVPSPNDPAKITGLAKIFLQIIGFMKPERK